MSPPEAALNEKKGAGALPAGKLPVRLLGSLLRKYSSGAPGLVVGPSIGVDSAIIDIGGTLIAAKSDPITFVSEDIGEYAVHVNANDIAVMGGVPKWFLATVLLPEGRATAKMARELFAQVSRACNSAGAALAGGHTEVTNAVQRPLVAGHMLGTLKVKRPITSSGAKTGDVLILTKGIAIEATSVIARTLAPELAGSFPPPFIRRCAAFFRDPGISVVKDAHIAIGSGEVHAMHDPTEGGLSAALHELSIASNRIMTIDEELIPVYPETRALCAHFGIDPLGAISSGSLLISAAAKDSASMLQALRTAGIPSAIIGRVGPKGRSVRAVSGGRSKKLKHFERDELTKILV